jgi:TPR repeat protein
MVVSYCSECTNLRKVAEILVETDILGNPAHVGKTVWIDVLCTRQLDEDSALNPDSIVTLYSDAFEHLVMLSSSFFKQARCLLELVITSSAGDIHINVDGDEAYLADCVQRAARPAAESRQNSQSVSSFYARMEASHKTDLEDLRALATRRFASPDAFDDAVRLAIRGLRAAILFFQASQLDYPILAAHDGDDAAAARAALEKAAALGHADAACLLGRYHELGRGGLAPDAAAAARLYRQAADAGSARGRFCLALALRRGDGGLPRDAAAAARMYSLAEDGLGSWLAAGGRPAVWCAADLLGVWTWERQGAVWPAEAARREAARIARLGAARRGGAPAPAEQVAMAVAGGPAWDSFAAAIAAAGDEARRAAILEPWGAEGGRGCGGCAVA